MYLNKKISKKFRGSLSSRSCHTSYAHDSISSGSLKFNSPKERYDSHRNPDDAE